MKKQRPISVVKEPNTEARREELDSFVASIRRSAERSMELYPILTSKHVSERRRLKYDRDMQGLVDRLMNLSKQNPELREVAQRQLEVYRYYRTPGSGAGGTWS